MRALQNFKGFHSNGRDIFPAGFTFGSPFIECGGSPPYGTAFTFSRVQGVSNTINIQVVAPLAASEILTLWYAVSGTTLSLNFNRSPSTQTAATFTDITFGGTISGVTNGHYVYFGVDSADPFVGTEFVDYQLRISNVTPGLTLGTLTIYNLC